MKRIGHKLKCLGFLRDATIQLEKGLLLSSGVSFIHPQSYHRFVSGCSCRARTCKSSQNSSFPEKKSFFSFSYHLISTVWVLVVEKGEGGGKRSFSGWAPLLRGWGLHEEKERKRLPKGQKSITFDFLQAAFIYDVCGQIMLSGKEKGKHTHCVNHATKIVRRASLLVFEFRSSINNILWHFFDNTKKSNANCSGLNHTSLTYFYHF